DDVPAGVVGEGAHPALGIDDPLDPGGDVVTEGDPVAVAVGGPDDPPALVVLGAHPAAAERVVDLLQPVLLAVGQPGDVVGPVGHRHEVAVPVVPVPDRV